MLPEKMAIKRVDAQGRDFTEKARRDAVIGPGAPGRNGDRPIRINDLVSPAVNEVVQDDLIGDPSVEEGEPDTMVDADGVKEEVGEGVRLRFDGHEDVKGVLGKARILLKHGVEEVGQGIGRGSRGRRDAMEKGARVRGLPNPDGSERERAWAVRVGEEVGGPPKGRCRSDKFVRREGQGTGAGTRNGGLPNPNSGPRIAGPNSMGTSGLGKMAKGKVSAPQVERSTVLRIIASKDSQPGRAE